MKIKTSELTGAALDWAVAKCEGVTIDICILPEKTALFRTPIGSGQWRPSTNWSQGGPILEREGISIVCMAPQHWGAHPSRGDDPFIYSETPLSAAMRCYVASKLGDEVEVPEELQ